MYRNLLALFVPHTSNPTTFGPYPTKSTLQQKDPGSETTGHISQKREILAETDVSPISFLSYEVGRAL